MDAVEAAAREAAGRAAHILREHWQQRKQVRQKSTAIDLVTETDRAAETAIIEVLKERFPGHGILAEESGQHAGDEHLWIIDPLDGTTNFAHGYPQICVSIGFRKGNRTVLGLVVDPLRQESFFARRGEGAFCNGARIHVSEPATLEKSLLATGFPYDRREHADFYLSYFKAFMLQTRGIRRSGSAALDLCFVAAGRVDAFWEWRLHPWDVAAGALIVEEAGGKVTDFEGKAFEIGADQILASNGRIHDAMVDVLTTLDRDLPSPGHT